MPGVPESERLILESHGVTTADEFFFRVPSHAALEEYLKSRVFPEGGRRRQQPDRGQ